MRDSRSCWCTEMRRNDSLLSREPTRGRIAIAIGATRRRPLSLPLDSRRWMTYRASFHLPKVRGMSWKMEQMLPPEPCLPSSGSPHPALHLAPSLFPIAGPGAQGLRGPGNCTEHPTWVTPPPLAPINCPAESGAPRLLPRPCPVLPLPLDLTPHCHRGILKSSSDFRQPRDI